MFPHLTSDELDALNVEDRNYAREVKARGWLPTKALPARKTSGPSLPPCDSVDASLMFRRWTMRKGSVGALRFEGLQGIWEYPADRDDVPHPHSDTAPDGDISFLLHSAQGSEQGDAGVFSMGGLARLYAQLHIRTLRLCSTLLLEC